MSTATTAEPIFDYATDLTPEPPLLYAAEGTAPTIRGFDAVDDGQVAFYREHGYLAIEGAFHADEVATMRAALTDLLGGRAPGFNALMYESGVRQTLATMSEAQRADAVRKLFNFVHHEPRLRAVSQHSALIGVVERLMGARPQLFQDMAMLKPPRLGREKPWHQDHAYFDLPPHERVVGVWIALDEATAANGCMHLLDGGHRDGAILHFNRRDWQICDAHVQAYKARHRCLAAPLPPGGVLLFDSFLPHGTPTNRSDQRRWAVQFHYAPAGAVKWSSQQRMAIFGSEGKDVTC